MAKKPKTPTVARQYHEEELGKLNDKIKDLRERAKRAEATAAALRNWTAAHLGTEPADGDAALLRDLALAIVNGTEAGWPTAKAQAVEGQAIHRPKPGSQPPSGGNPGARKALDHLRRRVRAELVAFQSKRRRDFGALNDKERDDEELDDDDYRAAADISHEYRGREVVDLDRGRKRRCWIRSCVEYGRTVPANHECDTMTPTTEEHRYG